MTTLALRPSRRAIQLFIFPALLQSLPTTTAEGSAGRPQNAPVAKVKLRSTSINPLNWSLVRQLCAPPAPRMLPRGCPTAGTAAFQIPREELLCQDAEKAGTARLVCAAHRNKVTFALRTLSPDELGPKRIKTQQHLELAQTPHRGMLGWWGCQWEHSRRTRRALTSRNSPWSQHKSTAGPVTLPDASEKIEKWFSPSFSSWGKAKCHFLSLLPLSKHLLSVDGPKPSSLGMI